MSDDAARAGLAIERVGDWGRVEELLEGFEDGIVKELWAESGSSVMGDDTLVDEGFPRLIVLVQMQSSPVVAARLTLEGVRSFEYDRARDVSPPAVRETRDGWTVEFLSCRVTATACTVEPLGADWLGRGPFLSS